VVNISLLVRDLIVVRGNFKVIADKLECPKSKVTVIIGPNGSGKSTLLRGILGIEKVIGGSIIIDGKDVKNLSVEKRELGYVPPKPTLLPNSNVLFNLSWVARLNKISDEEVERIIKMLNLEDLLYKKINHLSSGEAQKVAIARALIRRPKALIMDEPTVFLDINNKKIIHRTIGFLKSWDIPILIATNDLLEALNLGDKIYSIEGGRLKILEEGKDIHPKEGSY